jgi:chemotaxis protein methyltransferase CheR
MNEVEYECLKRKVRQLIQIDLNNYKENQMMRRLDGFISRAKTTDVLQYCARLDSDPAEVTKLRSFITINVSEFYRDLMHFETLRKAVLPELLKTNPRLSIWSAGCSDGEEPYTVAVILNELTPGVKHRIYASDIDKESLSKAAAGGPYQPQEIRNVPQPYLTKYFSPGEDGYTVNERIRERITFTQQDLTRDKFPFGFDLIICRNVTIYFSTETKRTLSLKFLSSLKENGVLFIGATETMLDAIDLGFQQLYPCFYRKNPSVPREELRILTPAVLTGSR